MHPASRPAVQVIRIHPHAPPKPPVGAACNGCGVCCLAEPCPLGAVLSRRLRGPCAALAWRDGGGSAGQGDSPAGRYVCSAISDPARWVPNWVPGAVARFWAHALAHLSQRWIAAGIGCDASIDVDGPAATLPGD